MIHLPAPRDNQWLFLDMNAFFASCEQHHDPSLSGKPIAVAPSLGPSACIIAASYEAKAHGITTGWRVGEAKQKLPELIVVPGNHRYYTDIHNRILSFLDAEVSPGVKTLSVDEFGIPLDTREQWTPNAHALAIKVKEGISDIFSPALMCSVGVAPNMFLAKVGTEIQKPNGLVVIQQHTIESAFSQLALREIPGINWGMSRRLNAIGIKTTVDFFRAPQDLLHNAFGITGDAWWYNLHGYNLQHTNGFRASERPKSISHSHVLAPALRTKAKGRAVLYKLWIKVADRLREKHLGTSRISIMARSHTDRWEHTLSLSPTQNVFDVFRHVAAAYDTELSDRFCPKQILVVCHSLTPHTPQPISLFDTTSHKVIDLFEASKNLNHKFGRWTVKPASLLIAGDAAPNRITFRKPDYEMD
ncbi:MAG TPA: hypothetical protein VGE59_01390 [Patescibacteria group bacterium]